MHIKSFDDKIWRLKYNNKPRFYEHEGFGGFSKAQFVVSKGFDRKDHILIKLVYSWQRWAFSFFNRCASRTSNKKA